MKNIGLAVFVCVVFSLTADPVPAQLGGEDVLQIGSRLELFVDEYLIESMDGVTRELHSPQPREVVFVFDQPWELGPCSRTATSIGFTMAESG